MAFLWSVGLFNNVTVHERVKLPLVLGSPCKYQTPRKENLKIGQGLPEQHSNLPWKSSEVCTCQKHLLDHIIKLDATGEFVFLENQKSRRGNKACVELVKLRATTFTRSISQENALLLNHWPCKIPC